MPGLRFENKYENNIIWDEISEEEKKALILDMIEEYCDDNLINMDSRRTITKELRDQRQKSQEFNHIITTLYPHTCFNPKCTNELSFGEAWGQARNDFTFKRFVKIWISPYIRFYCCSCYKEALCNDVMNKDFILK